MSTTHDCVAAARRCWGRRRGEIEERIAALWNGPELPAMEHRSAALLAGWLRDRGFAVEEGAGGLPTAFVARRRLGPGPRIGVLAEYDALPGLDNAVSCAPQPLGLPAGHGCGHNQIGPANCGAAIAAAAAAGRLGLGGEIAVFGCPAEELLWGKVALLRKGVFAGTDIALTAHGDYRNGAVSRPCQALVSTELVFLGRSGHGGGDELANALLGAEDAVAAIRTLAREAFADVSFRHVLRQGGRMPSITPAEARVWYTLRSGELGRAQAAREALLDAAPHVAAAAGLGLREQFIVETRGYLPNHVLGRMLADCLAEVGPPQWSAEALRFMESLSHRLAGTFTLDRGIAFHDRGEDHFSQDDGELSWRVPLGRLNWAFPAEVPIHHRAWTALSGHPGAAAGALMASEALAIAIVRLLAAPAAVDAAREELRTRLTGRRPADPRLGAWRTLTADPRSFWDATWTEADPPG